MSFSFFQATIELQGLDGEDEKNLVEEIKQLLESHFAERVKSVELNRIETDELETPTTCSVCGKDYLPVEIIEFDPVICENCHHV